MSGGGSDGEPARRHVASVGPCDGVDGGDAGGQEDGEQDHQEDEGGKQHSFYLLFFDWVGLWCLLIRGLAGGSGMLRCVRRENLARRSRGGDVANQPSCGGSLSSGDKAAPVL